MLRNLLQLLGDLCQGNEYSSPRRLAQAALLRLIDHTDDAAHRPIAAVAANVYFLAERLDVGEVPPRERFVDDHNWFSARPIAFIERTPTLQGHLHHAKIVGGDQAVFGRSGGLALAGQIVREVAPPRERRGGSD